MTRLLSILFVLSSALCAQDQQLQLPQEKHLANVRQLTFGGENAEAYFSADDKWLSFQHTPPEGGCDQIYIMPVQFSGHEPEKKLVSTSKGKTTCSYIYPGDKKILYSSTHLGNEACPPRPDYSKGYVWPIHAEYDIFTADFDGSNLKQLTKTPGYDAEATISRDGKHIVFTSMRDGDLELYSMNADGTHVKRLTHELGYDGGAFYSYDGKKIVYRAEHPADKAAADDYKSLLGQGLIRPGKLEIWVMDANGSHKHQ